LVVLSEEITARLALVMAQSMEIAAASIKEAFLGDDDPDGGEAKDPEPPRHLHLVKTSEAPSETEEGA
jgi:hypothetical protein